MKSSFLIAILFAVSVGPRINAASLTSDNSSKDKFAIVGVNDPGEVKKFLINLQDKLKANDQSCVANMVHIPITVFTDGAQLPITSKKNLIKNFKVIFNDDVSDIIACQKFETLGVNYQGIIIGRGVVYFSLVHQGNSEITVDNFDDRKIWRMQIIGINNGSIAHADAARCENKN
jgi:hypothetical protein